MGIGKVGVYSMVYIYGKLGHIICIYYTPYLIISGRNKTRGPPTRYIDQHINKS